MSTSTTGEGVRWSANEVARYKLRLQVSPLSASVHTLGGRPSRNADLRLFHFPSVRILILCIRGPELAEFLPSTVNPCVTDPVASTASQKATEVTHHLRPCTSCPSCIHHAFVSDWYWPLSSRIWSEAMRVPGVSDHGRSMAIAPCTVESAADKLVQLIR
ncbi:hypothetical protein BO71DRAFT_427552 [Aspergillus ellipticus CBS 707.79]|uniref:Uncharacterized protein n=1 Tax=Aspergillus ellipticus CBS 707.79 TaxID=1448320 RepID=A0A319EYH3_9EURO|nr:hypothetical protein BO71DRAFT_427552 [Aspergillus ellipticus CBS 707.79]